MNHYQRLMMFLSAWFAARSGQRSVVVNDTDAALVLAATGTTTLYAPTKMEDYAAVCATLIGAAFQHILQRNEDLSFRNAVVIAGNNMGVPEIASVMADAIDQSIQERDAAEKGGVDTPSAQHHPV